MKTSPFQLLQWKYAIRLEQKGFKNSRGSVNAHVAHFFGLKRGSKRATVLTHVEAALDACKAANVPANIVVEINPSH